VRLTDAPLELDNSAHMAALLTRMERDGLTEREPHPDDKCASVVANPELEVRD
jgi:hypothetical protein